MPLTRDFNETVRERAWAEPEFRWELLRETARCIPEGEPHIARAMLGSYFVAIYGIEELSHITGESSEDLTNMLNATDDPDPDELLAIIAAIADHEGIEMDVQDLARDELADLVAV